LALLRCENIGPRTFQRLLNRHGSAGALAALPELIASGKAGRPIRLFGLYFKHLHHFAACMSRLAQERSFRRRHLIAAIDDREEMSISIARLCQG
jgi:hypothetical protein